MEPPSLTLNPQTFTTTTTQKCTLGCLILDRCLGGGIPCNSVTELVSESGCGKTQLSLQLLLSSQLPVSLGGLAASSLYFHSEFPFPSRRLHQLSHFFRSSHPSPDDHDPCDRILVRAVHSADQLLDLLSKTESLLSNPPTPDPIKLIVIDSIAALFRSEFENSPHDLKRRSSLFFKISSVLKALAKRFELAVLVTNQVVDALESSEGLNDPRIGNLGCLYSSGRRVSPALGISWANCVNTRLFLSRSEKVVVAGDENGTLQRQTTRRQLHVLFAPHLPSSSCEFVILREGVFGVEN